MLEAMKNNEWVAAIETAGYVRLTDHHLQQHSDTIEQLNYCTYNNKPSSSLYSVLYKLNLVQPSPREIATTVTVPGGNKPVLKEIAFGILYCAVVGRSGISISSSVLNSVSIYQNIVFRCALHCTRSFPFSEQE